jgi:tetratricopeptide (TPR) repeat protein
MGVPRDDLLLMVRALKRGFADVKAIRKALDRQVSKPVSFLEALHLRAEDAGALRADPSSPDPVQDRPVLEELQSALVHGEYLTAAEWEKFAGSLTRPSQRGGFAPLPTPQEFDGYTLQWELARRERGVVYRAKDSQGRDVAIKVYRKDVAASPDLPRVAGHAYLVSSFVEGESLEGKRLSGRRAAQVIQKAAEQLRDRPHGGLTPARILVRRDDSVAVLGFDVARSAPPSSRALAYSSQNDAHALGAILYEVLVGAPPAGESSPMVRSKEVDAEIDRVVSCALTGGYGTTGALADDLARYLRGEPVTGRKLAAAAAPRRKPWAWAAAAAVPLAGLIVWLILAKGKPRLSGSETPVDRAAAGAPAPEKAPAGLPEAPAPPRPVPPPRSDVAKPSPPARPLTADEEQELSNACLEALAAKDYARVLATANDAVARGSKKDWPHYYLAVVYLQRDELDKALEYVSRALELSPQNRDYLEMRAHTFAFRGEVKKAVADFEDLYGRKAPDLNRQIVQLTRQVEADAKDGRSRLLRGIFFLLKRHAERAVEEFTAAVTLGQRRALAWRAFARVGMEERGGAAADAKTYLAEFPADFATEEVRALLRELGGP